MRSPSGVRGSGRQHIFGIFEVHRTLLVEKNSPNRTGFSVKKSTQSTIGGRAPWPPSEYASALLQSDLHRLLHSTYTSVVNSYYAPLPSFCNITSSFIAVKTERSTLQSVTQYSDYIATLPRRKATSDTTVTQDSHNKQV